MWLIASLCDMIEMRSLPGLASRCCHNRPKVMPIASISALYWVNPPSRATDSTSPARSDQVVRRWRSSHGKSNSLASIPVVSSIETFSTQSNGWPSGSESSTSAVRSRTSACIAATSAGPNEGATVRRWAVWRGGSIAMNIGERRSSGWRVSFRPAIVIPPYS